MFTFSETHTFQNAVKCWDSRFFLIQLLAGQLQYTCSTQYSILQTVCLSVLIYQPHSLLHHYPYSAWSACWWEKVIVSFLPDFSHEIFSHYNSKISYVWNLSSLEHFYFQSHYLFLKRVRLHCVSPVIQLLALSHAWCFKGSLESPVMYLNIWVMQQLVNIFLPELHR